MQKRLLSLNKRIITAEQFDEVCAEKRCYQQLWQNFIAAKHISDSEFHIGFCLNVPKRCKT